MCRFVDILSESARGLTSPPRPCHVLGRPASAPPRGWPAPDRSAIPQACSTVAVGTAAPGCRATTSGPSPPRVRRTPAPRHRGLSEDVLQPERPSGTAPRPQTSGTGLPGHGSRSTCRGTLPPLEPPLDAGGLPNQLRRRVRRAASRCLRTPYSPERRPQLHHVPRCLAGAPQGMAPRPPAAARSAVPPPKQALGPPGQLRKPAPTKPPALPDDALGPRRALLGSHSSSDSSSAGPPMARSAPHADTRTPTPAHRHPRATNRSTPTPARPTHSRHVITGPPPAGHLRTPCNPDRRPQLHHVLRQLVPDLATARDTVAATPRPPERDHRGPPPHRAVWGRLGTRTTLPSPTVSSDSWSAAGSGVGLGRRPRRSPPPGPPEGQPTLSGDVLQPERPSAGLHHVLR